MRSPDKPAPPERTAGDFFSGRPDALNVYRAVHSLVEALGPVEIRTTRSQVAFRRRRGFAYLWLLPGWLAERAPDVAAVLSLALDQRVESPRFKEIAHPSPKVWMHHMEVRSLEQIDGQVARWLGEAYEAAS